MRAETKVLTAKNEYFCFWARQLYYYNCARVKRNLQIILRLLQFIFLKNLLVGWFFGANGYIIEASTTQHTERLKMKAVNYTPEQSAKMVADYVAGVTPETIAQELGKTVRSVVAKLSREGVYKAKTYTTKTGQPVVKKDAHADAIGAILKMTEAEIESLTKANKTALEKIFSALANSKPI